MPRHTKVIRKAREDVNHHIHRLDGARNGTDAWRVQVDDRKNIVRQPFPDRLYGGKRAALRAARAFRDELLARVDEAVRGRWRDTRLRRNNQSGIAGVARYVRLSEGPNGGEELPYWTAFWNDAEGVRRSRKFSVAKYGEDDAELRAIAARMWALDDKFGAPRRDKKA